MKIRIKANELKRILRKLKKHGTKKSSSTFTCKIRVTENRVEISEFYLLLSYNNLNKSRVYYSHLCLISEFASDCEIEQTGSACIRSDSILTILELNFSSEFITIEKKESFLLITRDNGKQDEVPLLEDRRWDRGEKKIKGSLKYKDMIRLLNSSLFIAPQIVSKRNHLNHVIRMNLNANEISLVATDGVRLSKNGMAVNKVETKKSGSVQTPEVNVHSQVLKILRKEIKRTKCEYVKIVMYDQSNLFIAGNTMIEEESRKLNFPKNWKSVIPETDSDLTFSVKRAADLKSAIEHLAEGESVTLNSSKKDSYENKMQVKKMIPSEDGKFKDVILMSILNKRDSIDEDSKGGKKESGFNVKFVLDALKSIHDEDVDIYISSNSIGPSLLISSENSLNIIMSIKLD